MTLGKENIKLNNQLMWSILINAYQPDVPEPLRVPSKSIKRVCGNPNSSLISSDGFLPSSSSSNGDHSTRSPCKSRIRDRKVHDRRLSTNTIPPHVNSNRADSSARQGVRVNFSEPHLNRAGLVKARTLPSITKALENGDFKNHDLSRPLQLGPASSTAEQPEAEALPQSKRPRLENDDLKIHDLWKPLQLGPASSTTELREAEALPQSKRPRLEILASTEQVFGDEVGIGAVDVGNEELVKEELELSAPFGIQFRSGNIGFARRPHCSLLSDGQLAKEQGCLDNSELPTTKSLRRWMEQLAESMGLQGVSEDSANVLNHGLDAFLKRLIKSCIYLKGGLGQESEVLHRQSPCTLSQEIVRVKHSNSQWMSNACIATDTTHMEGCRRPSSFLDFKTAMELNPELLGGLRPSWMEKICFRDL